MAGMKDRVNKPKAFISYSSLDEAFIERIERDFRSCQIEPWRDRKEIRDGRPWLESIFEEGLPTCDVIIAYFTENSLNSRMVAKEVDAAQIRQLADRGISFLPYVNQSEIRSKMRIDLQSLQCRVWNDENYYEVLPSVVAEIWRSYMERNLAAATSIERMKRLEAELELERLQATFNASVFTPQEEREFQHVYSKMQQADEGVCKIASKTRVEGKEHSTDAGTCEIRISFIEVLKKNIDKGNTYFGYGFLDELVKEIRASSFLKSLPIENPDITSLKFKGELRPILMMFGLLNELREESQFFSGYSTSYVFSEKMYRFAAWLDYHGEFGTKPSFELVEFVPIKTSELKAAAKS